MKVYEEFCKEKCQSALSLEFEEDLRVREYTKEEVGAMHNYLGLNDAVVEQRKLIQVSWNLTSCHFSQLRGLTLANVTKDFEKASGATPNDEAAKDTIVKGLLEANLKATGVLEKAKPKWISDWEDQQQKPQNGSESQTEESEDKPSS